MEELKAQIKAKALGVLQKRWDRLSNRKLVFFPILRCLMLLNKIKKLEVL